MLRNMIEFSLNEASKALNEFMTSKQTVNSLESAANLMILCLKNGGCIYSCGNGGSMCDASHFAEELSGRYRVNRIPLKAIALSDSAYLTCVGNDYGYENSFSRAVEGFGNKGDVLLTISTSGNSANIVNAAKMAKKLNMSVIALTGAKNSNLSKIADVTIHGPESKFSDRIQEIHIKCIHILIQLIEFGVLKITY